MKRGYNRNTHGDPLTPRQQQVFDIINDMTKQNGYPPTIRDIAEAAGISSPNGVLCHLKAMKAKGVLRHNATGRSRSWVVSKDAFMDNGTCPTCGQAMPKEEDLEEIDGPDGLEPG